MRRAGWLGLLILLPLAVSLLLGAPPRITPLEDALLHAGVSGALSLCALLALAPRGRGLAIVVLGLVLAALLSELAQALLTSDRSASLEDLLADLVGLAVALAVRWALVARR